MFKSNFNIKIWFQSHSKRLIKQIQIFLPATGMNFVNLLSHSEINFKSDIYWDLDIFFEDLYRVMEKISCLVEIHNLRFLIVNTFEPNNKSN